MKKQEIKRELKKTILNSMEIKQWKSLTTSHYGSVLDMISEDETSWIYMPLICIALERIGALPYDIISVPLQEKIFWEQNFLSEILYLEDRFKNNEKEPEIRLRGSSLFSKTPERKLMNFLMDEDCWTSSSSLKENIQILAIGLDLANKLDTKIIQITEHGQNKKKEPRKMSSKMKSMTKDSMFSF